MSREFAATKVAEGDVASIDGIISAMYETISGAAGEPRDWERERRLCLPDARMVPVSRTVEGEYIADVMSIEEYIRSRTPFFETTGFYETEIARRTEQYGPVAQVFSTYESRTSPGQPPFMRGVNSIQLVFERGRWWIVSVAWQHETPEMLIPAQYLRTKD